MAIGDGELGRRGAAIMMPLELGSGRILRRITPSLSPQERTGSDLFSTDRQE
jgi:hypothetical protein